MSEVISKVINGAAQSLANRMALVWFCLFTFAALANSVVTALYGMRWSQIDAQDRLVVGLLIFSNWATTMMAFFSKAISRLQKGESPVTDGDDQIITPIKKP